MTIKNAKKLGQAIKEGQDTIEIEGDLKKKVLRIKATGKVSWAVAIGAIGVALASVILAPTPEPSTKVLGFMAAPIAVGVLGAGAASTSISIALAAGSIGALNTIRKYKIIKNTSDLLVLKRK